MESARRDARRDLSAVLRRVHAGEDEANALLAAWKRVRSISATERQRMKKVRCKNCRAMTANVLCDRCLREQGQTQLGEAIAEKIERGTVRGMHAARVT